MTTWEETQERDDAKAGKMAPKVVWATFSFSFSLFFLFSSVLLHASSFIACVADR
jgi:hypothetical protein